MQEFNIQRLQEEHFELLVPLDKRHSVNQLLPIFFVEVPQKKGKPIKT